MNNRNLLLLPVLVIVMISCAKKEEAGPPCTDPKPLQPSFTQNLYQVHVGQSVTFTYDGPTQPAGVSLDWSCKPLDENSQASTKDGSGATFTVTFEYAGSYSMILWASNCNADHPYMEKSPAVIVSP